ncbi:MAG: outer membrane protein assembly factor BamA [Sedimentisphaerales bacterium]|nr:outer membrane protein assembly factor BamA [Sedimentisphaerales bacterium]
MDKIFPKASGKKNDINFFATPLLKTNLQLCCLTALLIFIAHPGPAYADDAALPDSTAQSDAVARIRQIRITGNNLVSTATILGQVKSRSEAIYTEKTVAEDARRILVMPQIADVKWQIVPIGDQVDIVFDIKETEQISKVEFVGNKNLTEKELLEQLGFGTDDFLDPYLINLGAESLTDLYHEKGYYFARVNINPELLRSEKRVSYIIVEGPKVRVKKTRFTGNDSIPTRKLKGKVKTKGYFPIFSKGRLNDDQLEQDRLALQTYYRSTGFLDARATFQKQWNEEKTRVIVTFIIDEGSEYKVAGIRFQGNEKIPEEQLRDSLDLELGKVLNQKRQTFAQRAVDRTYGKEGYIFTDVQAVPEYTENEGEAILVFNINESDQFSMGRLLVRGNYETQDKVVRRAFDHFGFLPGGIYNTDAMERGKKRLLGAGLFESVEVYPIGTEPKERDALVEIKETRTGIILFGVGVDTNSGLLGQFSIEQRNFDASNHPRSLKELLTGDAYTGGGQQMKVSFSPGTRVTTGHIRFYEPYLFDQPYYFETSLMLYRRWRESYLERRRGGTVTFGHRFTDDWSAEIGFRTEIVDVTDLDDGRQTTNIVDGQGNIIDTVTTRIITAPQDVQDVEGSNLLTSVRFGLACNKTDNLYRPSQGYKLNTGWEQVGAIGGDFSYSALSGGGTIYRTVYQDITERKTVWAGNLRASQIFGDAPVFERYYAGGIGSLRGFDYRGVSPRAGIKRDPIGSDILFLAGTELTHPLFEEVIFGKLFCDTGTVSEGTYRVAVGFGLELVIPQLFQMIPMHFDFGFPVYQDDEDEEEVFSFSFGLSF